MNKRVLGLLLLGLLLWVIPLQAQDTIVYGIFFYSPTCPHCHEVIDNHWDNIQSEFGNQLKVLFVDVTTESGSQRMRRTLAEMGIPSNSVPMLIIGTDVLLGSIDIPTRTPPLVRAGLANGGIAYPPVTGIENWFEQEFGVSEQTSFDLANLTFASDKIANSLAVLVLIALVVSLLTIIIAISNAALRDTILGTLDSFVVIGCTVFGMILAFSILISNTPSMPIQLLAAGVATAFGAILVSLFVQPIDAPKATWLIPMLLLVGLSIAGYLTYIKFTTSPVSCGAIGNCGAVQHSDYAQVFGIPIGVLGLVGYSVLLVIWFGSQYAENDILWQKVLFGLTLCGVAFSAYLTFLEPFVIGATCVWCLLSAQVMLMLLWLTAALLWQDIIEETPTVVKRRHAYT
jgi:uncharacterized membrane protein